MTEEFNTDAVELIRAILSEHFNNYAFVVLEDDGTLFYDYNNHIIGETLFIKSLEDMQAEAMSEALSGLDWEEDEEEND
tara:strand:- start:82 stop:318 length:237 start_codon:yes stop_codon:yes gene_type:complete